MKVYNFTWLAQVSANTLDEAIEILKRSFPNNNDSTATYFDVVVRNEAMTRQIASRQGLDLIAFLLDDTKTDLGETDRERIRRMLGEK